LAFGLVGIGLAQNLISISWPGSSLGGLYDAPLVTDLSRQGKKFDHGAYTVRRIFEHDLLAIQRVGCGIAGVAGCVFHLCWSAARDEFANLLVSLATKYWLRFKAETPYH
jgi:hypothetical protein